jgi:hypothetical protein
MTNYMSGTSFATPIAVALVANIFAFYRAHRVKMFPPVRDYGDFACTSPMSYKINDRLENFNGVQKVLLAMSDVHSTLGYKSIIPWKKMTTFYGYADEEDDFFFQLRRLLRNP